MYISYNFQVSSIKTGTEILEYFKSEIKTKPSIQY